ncbi:MAG: D-2-hydroxyacid dehydrogenase [Saprospiraceae bacterium]|nr:D-2-hydroxyacid dehydrogenase [Saprospiraceae bacterium]MBP7699685.1 D-2-hydroxyacid dehydrogenase [Saprospiraceae bacterium]
MIKILVTDGIHPDGKMLLEEANYQVDVQKVPQEELAKVLKAYDVIIVRSATQVRKDVIDVCPNLKIIARGGVGLDNIDAEYAQSKGITVMNTPASSSKAVAELAFAHIFALARNLHLSNREMPSKGTSEFDKLKKNYSQGVQLRGKTLGIIGFGRIGQEVARIGVGLGMNILATDIMINETNIGLNIFKNDDVSLSLRIKTESLERVLRESDFISLHIPSADKPVIGVEELSILKKGSYLINTARGGTIDEEALLNVLSSDMVAGVGLDVFEDEPTPRVELLNHPKVSVSPHIGASTLEAQQNIGYELADRIIAFFGDDK